jgi:hypothetical protein
MTAQPRSRCAFALLPLLLLLVIGVLVAGCSGGDGGAATATSGSGSATPTPPVIPPATASTPPGRTGTEAAGTAPPVDPNAPKVAITTLPPVPVGSRTPISANVLVSVGGLRALTVSASGPGEIAGSAVAFAVEIRNQGSRPVDLGGFTVTASYGSDVPASPSNAAPADPLTGRLAPGGTAAGTYVFRMPANQIESVRIQVSSNASPNVLVFRR